MPYKNPHPLYYTWCKIRFKAKKKAIPICTEWLNFDNFVNDVGVRPEGHILNIKDNSIGYTKDNFIWSSESDKYKVKIDHQDAIHHPLYSVWRSMINRCTCETSQSYKHYGGRGISICQEWLDSFHTFVKDMGERPKGASIDRINVNGNYEPSNCRWATRKEQQSNKRNNVLITYDGITKTLKAWSDELGVKSDTIKDRIESGYSLDIALFLKRLPKANKFTGNTACSKGHPYTPENTRITKEGWRNCRTCHNAKMRARTADKKIALSLQT